MRLGIFFSSTLGCGGGAGGLVPRQRLHPSDIAPHDAHARGVLELPRRPLEAQVELLLLELQKLVLQRIGPHGLQITEPIVGFHDVSPQSGKRSTKRVRIGNLAAPSLSASRAIAFGTPSTSNMMRPGFTRQHQNSGAPLPLPMRTSMGFFETGTSGNTMIQTRP